MGRRQPSFGGTSRMNARVSSPDVCPVKASMFSRGQFLPGVKVRAP